MKCDECSSVFGEKHNLNAHIKKFHKKGTLPSKKNPTFKCTICEKLFVCKSTLVRHENKFHKSQKDHAYTVQVSFQKTSRLLCPQDSCPELFSNYGNLRSHLLKTHHVEVELENIEFNSLKSFETWKTNIQNKEFSVYTRDTAPKKLSGTETLKLYYNCNRSYSYIPKGKNIRSLKSGASNKIGKACPSRLEVTIEGNLDSPSLIKVKYWKTHFGHDLQLAHVPLDRHTRSEIAEKLKEGVSFKQILDSIQNNEVNVKDINPRLSILNRKDLHNIIRDFKIDNSTKRHENDEISEQFSVTDMQEDEDSSVLYYDGQEEEISYLNIADHDCAREEFEQQTDIKENFDDTNEVSNHQILPNEKIIEKSEEDFEQKTEKKGNFDETNKVSDSQILPNEKIIKKSKLILRLLKDVTVSKENSSAIEAYLDNVISILNKKDGILTTEHCQYSTNRKKKKPNNEFTEPSISQKNEIKDEISDSTEILSIIIME